MAAATQLRAGTAVVCSGLSDTTMNGARGFIMPTEVEPSPTRGCARLSVRLQDAAAVGRPDCPFVQIKPVNLLPACAGCWECASPTVSLKACSKCLGPRYCGRECQTVDWAARHKAECKELRAVRDSGATPPPHVTSAPPHAFPWRITLETPAMMHGGFTSFLTAHPNQRFVPGLGRLSRPGANASITSMPVLREEMSACATPEGTASYYARVPFHWPSRCVLGVVGECVLTRGCIAEFASLFDAPSNRGAIFRWPIAAAVSLDFRTGEPLAPCAATTLLLVAHMICGTYDDRGAADGKVNLVQRVQPRLMSIDSFHAIVGEHRNAMMPPFYPDVVRAVTRRPGQRAAPLHAAALWERFCDVEKLMPSFEQLQQDEMAPVLSALGIKNQAMRPVEVL
jgi:hypothetical protein